MTKLPYFLNFLWYTFAEVLKLVITYRHITAFIFLAAILAQVFSGSLVVAEYYTNISKYAKNCENKERPKMHCNGKCQMMKKLQQEEKKDQGNPGRKAENKTEVILSSKSFWEVPNTTYKITLSKELFSQITIDYSFSRINSIFHPPKA